MPLQKLPVQAPQDANQWRRSRETLNQVLDHTFDDSRTQTAAEVIAGITPINKAYPPYHLFRYIPIAEINSILDGTSIFDCTSGLQNAIDSACITVQGRPPTVTLPSGLINVTFVNCTNTRGVGTIQRDGLIIEGEGRFATLIMGSPGKNKAVIECSGSQGFRLKDMSISGISGSVGVGIFTGSSTLLNQSHQQHFQNIYVSIPTDATANGGNGTVGFWNFGSEENVHLDCYYEADQAAIFTSNSASPFAYLSPVNTLSASHSCGVNQVNASMKALTTSPVLTTVDVGSLNFHGYLLGQSGGIGYSVLGVYLASEFDAIVEDVDIAIEVQGSVQSSRLNINLATADTSASCIRLRDASAIVNSDVLMFVNGPINKMLMSALVATSTTASTTALTNSSFKTNLDKAYILNGDIQFTGNKMVYVLLNSSNVQFSAPGYQYDIYEDRHELKIPRVVVSLVGGATPAVLPIAKAIAPANTIANQGGIGTVVEVNGLISGSAANANSWGARIQCFLPFYADYVAGALTLGTAAGTILSKVVQTAASFDPTAVTLTGAIASNEITVNVSVTRAGATDTAVEFRGTATLWRDPTSTGSTSLVLL